MEKFKNSRLWYFRYLFIFLIWRDVKVRYKQAILGVAWALLSPIVLAFVFWVVFSLFFPVDSGPIPYILLIFSKLTFWNFFTQSVSSASLSLTGNTNLITRSSFPREILVFSSISVRLVDLVASIAVLLALAIFFRVDFSFEVLWLVPILVVEFFLATAFGLIFSSLNVYFRDINVFLPLMMTAWLFVTPVIYSLEKVPAKYHIYLLLNPMTGVIEGIKQALLMQSTPNLAALGVSTIMTVFFFVFGYILFKKLEKSFADVI